MAKKKSVKTNVKKQSGKKEDEAGKQAEGKEVVTKKTAEKQAMNFSNPKFRALLLLGIALLSFGFIFIDTVGNFNDPWYNAVALVDSSAKVSNPALKQELLNRGGNELRELLKEHPYHARLYYFMGYYHKLAKNWDSAIACQKKAIYIGSGGLVNNVEYDAHTELILAIMMKGDKFYNEQQPDSAIAYFNQALEEAKTARMTQRMQNIVKQLMNNISMAYFSKGNLEGQAGSSDKAIEQYNNALKYAPNKPDIYNNMGIVYSGIQDYENALKYFNKALEIDPNYEKAKTNIMQIRAALKAK